MYSPRDKRVFFVSKATGARTWEAPPEYVAAAEASYDAAVARLPTVPEEAPGGGGGAAAAVADVHLDVAVM